MKKVTLQFPDQYRQWGFIRQIQTPNFEVDNMQLLVICNFSDEDIELAINDFKATVLITQSD